MKAGTCRFCGCRETSPCEGGCSWADDARTVCSQCHTAVDVASAIVKVLSAPAVRKRLADAVAFDDLPAKEQLLLVMTCRATVEGLRDALLDGLTMDAIGAHQELAAVYAFLAAKCPEQLQRFDGEQEALSEVVIRLLEPHVGSRIVLPGVRA